MKGLREDREGVRQRRQAEVDEVRVARLHDSGRSTDNLEPKGPEGEDVPELVRDADLRPLGTDIRTVERDPGDLYRGPSSPLETNVSTRGGSV